MTCAVGEPAQLYHTPGLQAPVRTGPDELLLLPGFRLSPSDRVVYRALDDSGNAALDDVPTGSTALAGVAEVIAAASDAYALVVRTPPQIEAARAYAFAVVNAQGEWSNAVRLNDARALWLSPWEMPARGANPGLNRRLRIVGQNLATAPGANLRVRLKGPAELELPAQVPANEAGEFVADVMLPETMAAGSYKVSIRRAGQPWTAVPAPLRIIDTPGPRPVLTATDTRFGHCRPDDALDDTDCIVAALAAAQPNGAIVLLPAGAWKIGAAPADGIVIPRGVSLAGDATHETRLERGADSRGETAGPLFVLIGDNVVSRIRFLEHAPHPAFDRPSTFLQLGRRWYVRAAEDERAVRNVTITGNEFSGADFAVANAGRPMERLVVTGNLFRARRLGLSLDGDGNNVRERFRLDDAIISGNRFEPGSYLDVTIRQGTRAAEFGAGARVDLSDNLADGVSTAGLDAPGDAHGWRAAFFWDLRGAQEQWLIAGNQVSCSGDKVGDGEAFALDNNHNAQGFARTRNVIAADENSVTVPGPLAPVAEGRAVDAANYYLGHWLRVAAGPGIGQLRRVAGVAYDSAARSTRFAIEPAWDVVPRADASAVTVARVFWQMFVVGNQVDQRAPPCRKGNRSDPRGGAIVAWGQSADSVIAHNQQFDTDGILFHHSFSGDGTAFHSFLDTRGNEIRGEYDAARPASESGIRGPHGAAADAPPPVESFGVSISHNLIDGADSGAGAAIRIPLSWYAGPAPHRWPLIDRLLIFQNDIAGVRTGIEIPASAQVRDIVLFANRCAVSGQALRVDARVHALCAPGATACECGR